MQGCVGEKVWGQFACCTVVCSEQHRWGSLQCTYVCRRWESTSVCDISGLSVATHLSCWIRVVCACLVRAPDLTVPTFPSSSSLLHPQGMACLATVVTSMKKSYCTGVVVPWVPKIRVMVCSIHEVLHTMKWKPAWWPKLALAGELIWIIDTFPWEIYIK